jgi:elongation factor Ts
LITLVDLKLKSSCVEVLMSAGAVTSYIHAAGRIGVLLELICESDFVAQTEDFRELMHDIAMHIAASDPRFIRKEDVTPEAYEREREIYRSQAESTGKPPAVVEKIVEGKMTKFYEDVCLYEQPFVKDQTISVGQLIAGKASKLGEDIAVRRFARFKVGEDVSRAIENRGDHPEGGEGAGVAVKKPKGPTVGSGSAAAKPDE